MSEQIRQVLTAALKLSPLERAELVEQILASFSFPDRNRIDELWAEEVDNRIEAYERGELKSKPESEVFAKIERGKN